MELEVLGSFLLLCGARDKRMIQIRQNQVAISPFYRDDKLTLFDSDTRACLQ